MLRPYDAQTTKEFKTSETVLVGGAPETVWTVALPPDHVTEAMFVLESRQIRSYSSESTSM